MTDLAAVDQIINRRLEGTLADLARLCAQPSVSASGQGIRECAALVGDMLQARGFTVRTMETIVHTAVGETRFQTTLLALFAGLSLLLAAVGIYGVMAFSVSQRAHEIGVRMALGAQRRNVLSLILGQGALLAVLGVAVGLASAFALSRLLSTLLYRVAATDRPGSGSSRRCHSPQRGPRAPRDLDHGGPRRAGV